MKKRLFASLLCLALCLGLLPTTALAEVVVVPSPGGGDGDISVDVNPDEPGNVTVIVPGEDGGDVVVVIPPEEEEAPVIGDVVNFAGHEWYIIGTDDEADGGVTAPEGCYTLFAKNNDFGSTAFRAGVDGTNVSDNYYKDSDLQKEMGDIANGFSEADRGNISPRATLDGIAGDSPTDQLLWPVSEAEWNSIDQSLRAFQEDYWTRTNASQNVEFVEHYTVKCEPADGQACTAGVLCKGGATVTDIYAVRPAMYVKADAFTGGAEASSVLGDTVSFAGHEWYIIGTGLGGVTAPEGCYTLFAKYDDFGSTVFRAGANDGNSTANHYKDSDLQNKMEEIANSSLSAYKEDIVARATLDGIAGDSPTDQLLWPISKAEWESIDQSVRAFPADYWTRAYYSGNTDRGGPVYRGWKALADGSILGGTLGLLSSFGNYVGDTNAVRPALYVKAEAVGAPKVTVPLTGGKVYFGSQDWYIVGMDDVGPVPGPSKTVTLFADSIVEGQYATTNINYSQGNLCAAMNNLGASLNLSAQAQSLISSRMLTTEDEITGDSVTTPFWPLSKSEFEAIQAENQSLLEASWKYWLRTEAPFDWEIHRTVYAGDTDGTLTQNSTPSSNFGVRPAFYLDLSTLFFAAGESSMGNSVNGNPVKLMPPGTDSSQKRWNFVMYDSKNLSLSMSAEQGQSGQSLTFQYNGTGGAYHFLAYVLEQDGVPIYYGKAANLIDSGSGTVTVPLLGVGSDLEDGDYTMRFYVEDRTDGIYFASDTVDLKISVGNGVASITGMGEVTEHIHSFGTELKFDETNHWRECACGEKSQVFPHDYGNDQDETCNICGYEREVVHQHTLQWLFSSGAGHWQQCIFCNEIMTSVEPHVYDDDQDVTCNVCDYKRQSPHSHDFGPGWKSDACAHWQECSCGEKTTAQAHSYADEQDPTCNVCGYVRELSHTHDFGPGWESDAFSHWHKCSSCGARDAEAAHSYDDDLDPECNVCGYVRDLSHTHTYSNSWDCDTSSHWHACIYCGEKEAEAAHVYDNDLDPECNVCKFKRVISHVHQGVLVSGTPATCTQEGSKDYYTCTCQQAFEDEACTRPIANLDSWKVIQPIPHIWSGTYLAENADESKHYHLCTVCGTKDAGEAHVYDNTEDIDCSICGYERQVTPPVGTEFTVNFDPNGGSVSPSSAVTADGRLASLPIPVFIDYEFMGWYTAADGGELVTVNTVFTGDATLYARWKQVQFSVSGTVQDDHKNAVSDAAVALMQGSETIEKGITGDDGTFTFTRHIPAGAYNIVTTYTPAGGDRQIKTSLVVITDRDETVPVTLPPPGVNSTLKVTADTPAVVVGGLDDEAEALKTDDITKVTVSMTVEKKTKAQAEGSSQIQQNAAAGTTLQYLEIAINATVVSDDTSENTTIGETKTVLEIVVPFNFSGKNTVTVYRYHGDAAEKLTEDTSKNDGTYQLDTVNGLIRIFASKFSTYAIGYTTEEDEPVAPPVIPVLPDVSDDGDPSYSVTLPVKVTGGTVTAKKSYAEEGETFRFTVIPHEGYELDSLTVTDRAGKELELTNEGGGEYSFKMPARRVEITVSFREIGPALPFDDVGENYWAYNEISWAYENGYMSGTAATTFNPGGTVSRQQVWMILARMAGEDPADMAAAKAWAVANGISDGTNPGGAVTRQQLAALLYRYAALFGYDVSVGENTNILSYTDVAQVSEYAIPAMQWACGAGIIAGTGDGSTLSPQGTATRAQLAVMLMRFCEEYVTW